MKDRCEAVDAALNPTLPMETPTTEDVLHASLVLLQQLSDLARSIDERRFRDPVALFGGGTIGQHLRHGLDHFEQLLEGAGGGAVDYDARGRDLRIETSPAATGERAEEFAARLRVLCEGLGMDGRVGVRNACSTEGEVGFQGSSLGRELQFLVSHTVHHFAIVAAMCRLQGVVVAEEFGVAPSTLRYRRAAGQQP